jgi:hypothetical protein
MHAEVVVLDSAVGDGAFLQVFPRPIGATCAGNVSHTVVSLPGLNANIAAGAARLARCRSRRHKSENRRHEEQYISQNVLSRIPPKC